LVPISFPIPLPAPSAKAFYLTNAEIGDEESAGFEAGCTGTVQQPIAPPEALCVYAGQNEEGSLEFSFFHFNEAFNGYEPTGTVMDFLNLGETAGFVVANGSWAVTAPES
jgi:hypothetical protein